MAFDPLSMLAGGSIPNIGSGDAGPAFSRSNLGQINYSAPFSVGKGNQSTGGNTMILALILVAGVVAVAFVRR